MLQVLQWYREASNFILDETIASRWVKSTILPILYENELKGEDDRKTKVGSENFRKDVEGLINKLALLNINDVPPSKITVSGLACKVVEDSGCNGGDIEEECETVDVKFNNEEDKNDDVNK